MMNKKIIALITNNDDDVYCFRKELIEAIIESGYRVLISCPYGPKMELMKGIAYIYDNSKIDRRGMNIFKDLKLLLHYKGLFEKYKPYVVLTYTAKPNVYASMAARFLRIPYINNVTGLGSVLNKNKIARHFILKLFSCAYRGSYCVMFQNSTNLKMARKLKMLKGRYMLIPGSGVNTNRFSLQKYPQGGNGISGDTVVFNYIGRILHDKGVDDFIRAAKIIKSKYPKTEFNMIGFIEPTESHYREELKLLEEQNIIYYRGSQKDIRPYIARSHAIIHPSTYGEGMSNVLLENASSGRPIITTDNPGCKETVKDQVSGYIYPGGNIKKLVSCIETFLKIDNESRREMGVNGRKRMEEHFSRTIVIEAYLSSIRDLMIARE